MARVGESLVSLARQLAGGIGAAVVTVALVHAGVLEPLETWARSEEHTSELQSH